jgi:hypothetical protein
MLPELTIIVPTLNEVATLLFLLDDLTNQQDVQFELIISDGGSADGTIHTATQAPFPTRIIEGPAGRPGQIDRAAALACGQWLLILHADSRLPEPQALRSALDLLTTTVLERGDDAVAGRFRLCFANDGNLTDQQRSRLEQKARLNRLGCIHGDQGLLLATSRYRALAPLSPTMPMLAETLLADQLLTTGVVLLFPHNIVTSSRRFTAEGLNARQTLNALIMNAAAINWPAFFTSALPLYHTPTESTGPLPLAKILRQIDQLLRQETPAERRRIWRATGGYVAANAWQLAFSLDLLRARSTAKPPTKMLDGYDRTLSPLITSGPGQCVAQWLTWCWFQLAQKSQAKKNG